MTFCGRETKYGEIKDLMVHPDKQRLREEIAAAKRIWHQRNQSGAIVNSLNPDFLKWQIEQAKMVVMEIKGTFSASTKTS